jgi:sorting nexin-29
VVTRWKEYFQEAVSGEIGEQVEDYPRAMNTNVESEVPSPTLEDVHMAVKSLNNNRSPGMDGIPAELYKHGCTKLLQHIHSIVTDVWERELLPAEWEEGIICPIYKKGDRLRCENYTRISLLNTAYKIFSKILSERLRNKIEAILGWYQTGFREGKGTIDQMHTLRQILERIKE